MIDELEKALIEARAERDRLAEQLAPIQEDIDEKVQIFKQSLMDAHEELYGDLARAEARLVSAVDAAKAAWLSHWIAYRGGKTTPSGLLQVRVSHVAKIVDQRAALAWVKANCPTYLIETFKPSFLKAAGQGLIPDLPAEAVVIDEAYTVAVSSGQ